MQIADLHIALFSGNYNYVRDGANQALNRLVDYLLRQGASVRVYSPTTDTPAFEPKGDLVSLPSLAIPGRSEFQLAIGLPQDIREDLKRFAPHVVHVSAPDISCHRAVSWARDQQIPVLASVHTRFETYPSHYNMLGFINLGFTEPLLEAILRRFYRRCDALVAPTQSMVRTLQQQRMHQDVSIWARGVDRTIFHPDKRDMAWRRGLGIADDRPVIGFLGRLVMEKGLDRFVETINALRTREVPHDIIVIGEGPHRQWFEERLAHAHFVGFQEGTDLGRAVASMDIFFNPSITETFGNVTLEAMACRLPVVAAQATGSESLVISGETGRLVDPYDIDGFADALATYCTDLGERSRHGAAGEARAADYDWDRINGAVADTYLRLLQQRQGASGAGTSSGQ